MKIEKGIISNTQLMYLIIGLFEASTFTAAFIAEATKQQLWIIIIIGCILMLTLLLAYIHLSDGFPQMNLIEINDIIYGRYIGKVVSAMYIFFFWYIVAAHFRYVGDFFSAYLFPETDINIFIIAMALISMYAVGKGIEVIGRYTSILAILTIIAAFFITAFTIKDINFNNFLPLLDIKLIKFIQGVNFMITVPFGELVVFLMFFPYVSDGSKVKRYSFLGLFIGAAYFLVVILRNIAVLGNIAGIHVLPSYQVAKVVNVAEVITRSEVLIAMFLLFDEFIKICVFYYATVLSTAQLLGLRSYKPLILPVGVISIIYSITMFGSASEQAIFTANVFPIYAIPVVILIPIVSLTITYIRRLPKGGI